MGKDLRINELQEISKQEFINNINNIDIIVDTLDEDDSQKIQFNNNFKKNIISNSDITDTDTLLTPESFLLSKATNTTKGIIKLAQDNDIINNISGSALAPEDLDLIIIPQNTHINATNVSNFIYQSFPNNITTINYINYRKIGKIANIQGQVFVNVGVANLKTIGFYMQNVYNITQHSVGTFQFYGTNTTLYTQNGVVAVASAGNQKLSLSFITDEYLFQTKTTYTINFNLNYLI